ncbi:MAG: chemotaxis protein CheA [Candidatus Sericytochromatia bacterium]
MDSDTDELLPVFILEIQEHLDHYDGVLLRLEQDPGAQSALQELFRILHTLKGGASLFGFSRLSRLVHQGETVASDLRDGRLTPHPGVLRLLFELGDTVRAALNVIQQTGQEPSQDYTSLSLELASVQAQAPVAPGGNGKQTPPVLSDALETPAAEPPRDETPAPEPLASEPPARSAPETATSGQALAESLLSVDVQLLNRLLDRSSELMILRHAFFQMQPYLRGDQQRVFQLSCLRYQALASELQDVLMQVRMQPIGLLWKNYPRLLRELSQYSGKQVVLETSGESTELDKSVLEAIRDPLIHLIRNAVDHGIESAPERDTARKPRHGTLRLSAYQDEGHIFVELSDDGQGLQHAVIRQRAVERGLISAAQAAELEEGALLRLIFQPGFSTASVVSEISGRGVGLDIVQTNLERVGGQVQIFSSPGQGTTFRLRLPLTLGVISGLILCQREQFYILPQHAVKEILLAPHFELNQVGGASYGRWRGQTLPYRRFDALTGSGGSQPLPYVVVIQGSRPFALGIEQVDDLREVMLKPLSNHWEGFPLLSGATVLGEGHLALVLSVRALEEQICREVLPDRLAPVETAEDIPDLSPDALLLFRGQDKSLLALPLSEVEQLDEVPAHHLQHTPQQLLLQRGDSLLPVYDIAARLRGETRVAPLREASQLILCRREGQRLGLLAAEILDIVDGQLLAQGPAQRPGTSHSVQVPEGVAEVLNTGAFWAEAAGLGVYRP